MNLFLLPLASVCQMACSNLQASPADTQQATETKQQPPKTRHYRGAISNGMKGDSLSFNISADGKRIENLTFKGWWRCSGKLEQIVAGPDGSFAIANGVVDGAIAEPPGGGSTSWRFELKTSINGPKASGSFRMNINNLGCDTYVLKFEAAAK